MGNLFYNLGRKTGRSMRKGKWVYNNYFGTKEEAIRAEYAAGKELAAQMETEIIACKDTTLQMRINTIGQKLVSKVKKKERRFSFTVYDSAETNAFALPGGFIFISSGILKLCNYDDDEIAFILAHEMVHIVSGHPLKRIMTTQSLNVISNAIRTGGVIGNLAKQTIKSLIESNYSQENEFAADLYGVQLIISAGFNARAGLGLFQNLHDSSNDKNKFDYFSIHPPIVERKARIERYLNKALS